MTKTLRRYIRKIFSIWLIYTGYFFSKSFHNKKWFQISLEFFVVLIKSAVWRYCTFTLYLQFFQKYLIFLNVLTKIMYNDLNVTVVYIRRMLAIWSIVICYFCTTFFHNAKVDSDIVGIFCCFDKKCSMDVLHF